MISLNFTVVLVFIAFMIFAQLLKRLFFDKVAALLAARESAIQQAQEEANSAIARYLELETAYEATLQEAHMQAKFTVSTVKQQAKKELELALLTSRQSLESDLVAHVANLHTKKQSLITQILQEKQAFLPLIEQQLLPSSAQQQGANIV